MKTNRTLIVLSLVLLSFISQSLGAYILYTSTHNVPPDLLNWLEMKGHIVNYNYAPDVLPYYLPTAYDMIIYQNDGGVGWDPSYETPIEDYTNAGGVFLYIGRSSLASADIVMNDVLGFSSVVLLDSAQSPTAFDSAIISDVRCYPLTNGYRRDLRGVIPRNTFPNWVLNHLHEINEGVVSDGISCLPSSFDGNGIWTIRDSVGSGKIVYMAVTTYVVEEFWKPGFFQAAFMNLLAYSSTGIIFGDPHVVTLDGVAYNMPDSSDEKYFNFYSSPTVSVSGYVQRLETWSDGLWVTEIGVNYQYRGRSHQLHCFFDENLMNFKFVLDDRELVNPEKTIAWEFSLDNEAVVGSWHDFGQFVSPGLFKLMNTDDGTKVIIQAVEWRDAPSFSVEVHEPTEEISPAVRATRNFTPGLLQHHSSGTRDLDSEFPNVDQFAQTSLFTKFIH